MKERKAELAASAKKILARRKSKGGRPIVITDEEITAAILKIERRQNGPKSRARIFGATTSMVANALKSKASEATVRAHMMLMLKAKKLRRSFTWPEWRYFICITCARKA